MCRWLTYVGEPVFLESLLYEPENSLIKQSLEASQGSVTTNGDGFGIGWYGHRDEPGVYHEVLPAWNDSNLKSLARQLVSPLFLAHVRASTGTETSRANCHPFGRGKWLFMHNGQIGGYRVIRRHLEALIPDDVYADRIGTTDTEVFFLLLFAHGLEDDPIGAVERTVHLVLATMADGGVSEPFRMTATLTDGKRVYALRYSSDAEPPTLYWWPTAERLIIVSEPLDSDASPWQPVPPSSLLVAVGPGDAAVRPFDVSLDFAKGA